MIEMANDKPMPSWRNFAVWSAMGAVFYIVLLFAGTWLLQGDGVGATLSATFRSTRAVAMVGLGLIFAMAVIGLTNSRRPLSRRTFRNFAIRDAMVALVFLLGLWGIAVSARAGTFHAMDASERVAAVTGGVLVVVALLGSLVTASVHSRVNFVEDEAAADDLRERGRLFLCSFAWTAACGLLLIVLSFAGSGKLSPGTALTSALVLVAMLALLGIAAHRLSDELGRTLSRETGNMACYLILLLGGGWAIVAHLGFAAAPAPLDWLTLFTVLLFAASFIAVGRRRLLRP